MSINTLPLRYAPWPLQDIRSLESVLALVNHHFIAPFICIAHSHHCNTIARLIDDIRTPPDPSCVCHTPHTVQYWERRYRVKANTLHATGVVLIRVCVGMGSAEGLRATGVILVRVLRVGMGLRRAAGPLALSALWLLRAGGLLFLQLCVVGARVATSAGVAK